MIDNEKDFEQWIKKNPNKGQVALLKQELIKEIDRLEEVIKYTSEDNSRLSHDYFKKHGYHNNHLEWGSSSQKKFNDNKTKKEECKQKIKVLKSILSKLKKYKPIEVKQLSLNLEEVKEMNEELKKIKIYPKSQKYLDVNDEEDSESTEITEEAVACEGGASFSQLGTAPTEATGFVKINGKPVEGKSVKNKKKIKESIDFQITNFNDPFIYGVDIRKLNNYSYEVNFVARQDNHKDVIPVYIARGVMFDDGEWFSEPEITEWILGLEDEVKYNIIDQFEDFKFSKNYDELNNIIIEKIVGKNMDEELQTNLVESVIDIVNEMIYKLNFKPVTGGYGFNFSNEGNNYTHVISYNIYDNIPENESVFAIDYMIFDEDNIRNEKSWEINSIEEAHKVCDEITSEYESWE